VPIYDYVCSGCGHRFEVFHGLNESGPHRCPECGGAVSRVFAPPTIVFKGSGWAKVDRRATSSPRKEARVRSEDAKPPSTEAGPTAPGDSKASDT
jgi:putative FmdB family regulatory protein